MNQDVMKAARFSVEQLGGRLHAIEMANSDSWPVPHAKMLMLAGIEAAIKPQADATCPACSGSGAIEMGWVDGVCQRCGGMGIEAATQPAEAEAPSDAEIEAIEKGAIECYEVKRGLLKRTHEQALQQAVRWTMLQCRNHQPAEAEAPSDAKIEAWRDKMLSVLFFGGDEPDPVDEFRCDRRWIDEGVALMRRLAAEREAMAGLAVDAARSLIEDRGAERDRAVEALRGLVRACSEFVVSHAAREVGVAQFDVVLEALRAAKVVIRG